MKNRKNLFFAFFTITLFLFCGGCKTDNDPSVERLRTTAKLRSFDSCTSLETALKANLKEELRINLLSAHNIYKYDAGGTDGAVPTSPENGRQEGVDYSGTNNQEAGVDEADFVKTDGYSLFVLNGNQLVILGVPEFGQLVQGTSLKLEGYPNQMLIRKESAGGRAAQAVIFSTVYTWNLPEDHPLHDILIDNSTVSSTFYYPYYRCSDLTKLTMIDLADPANPQVTKELYLEGYYQTARGIENSVHMVAYSWMDIAGIKYWPDVPEEYYSTDNQTKRDRIWAEAIQQTIAYNDAVIEKLSLEDFVPRMYQLNADNSISINDFARDGCTNFTIADDGASRGFTSILSFDLLDTDGIVDADHIVSNWSQVYASTDTLLIAEPAQDWWWYWGNETYDEATNIHRFTLSTEGTAHYTGSGRIAGTIENQFCLSEYNGAIRVAATTGRWNRWWEEPPLPSASHVYVLIQGDNNTLTLAGQTDPKGFAQGERIYTARLIGTKGYITTAKNIDPLWTIDLSDPANPGIIGALEVPGVSTYIHPLSDSRLLTIGYGGDETAINQSAIQVSLFNVSDFANPSLVDTLSLFASTSDNTTSSWGWSEALYEHKAFQYWAPKKMLAVPLSASRYTYKNDYEYFYEYISKLMLISVDNETGFSMHGNIDHSAFYNNEAATYWCNQDIRRSIFMGDYIYAIGDRGITASNIDNMTSTASQALPGSDCGMYIY